MLKKMKFGLIGGGLAGPLSAGALNDIKEAELVAMADIKEDVCKSFCKKYNVKDWYTDYKEMLKRDDIDAVCIATPLDLHEEMVVNAAKAGKHVMCEKAIARSLLEASAPTSVIFMSLTRKRVSPCSTERPTISPSSWVIT